ncbi:hypothetical protein MFIFM68171_02617 [Madurella fahalii]|uniref:Uncharacterized protein n=1 Tax=Madurella fahalii TaxID=1157608 RepID=A0ABQ0G3T8_9PEZI
MKLFTIGTLATLVLPSLAAPNPSKDLVSIVTLFTANKCAESEDRWAITTRMDTWTTNLKPNDGCQIVNKDWSISSMTLNYLYEYCSFTAYTDTNCKENGVTLPVDVCVTNKEQNWKSFAIRGCDRVN